MKRLFIILWLIVPFVGLSQDKIYLGDGYKHSYVTIFTPHNDKIRIVAYCIVESDTLTFKSIEEGSYVVYVTENPYSISNDTNFFYTYGDIETELILKAVWRNYANNNEFISIYRRDGQQ